MTEATGLFRPRLRLELAENRLVFTDDSAWETT